MKSRFEEPVMEMVKLHQKDIITTSVGAGLDSDDEFTGGGKDYGDLLG